MGALLQDIRYGLRTLLKNPGVALLAVFALCLGIGANTAIFSIVNAVMLRPLPVEEPDQLVMLFESKPQAGITRAQVSYANYADWKRGSQSFESMAAFGAQSFNVTIGGEPERVPGARVTADFFQVTKARPALGSTFTAEASEAGSDRVVILSHAFWENRFNSDPQAVGKTLILDGGNHTIIGVMPKEFQFPSRRTALWAPLAAETSAAGTHYLNVIARLKPEATSAQAQAEMSAVAQRLSEQGDRAGWGVTLITLSDYSIGNIKSAFFILFAAVVFVLLIACANVVNLLLSRAAARQKEVAIRAAIGATRLRILRQLLTESMLLSLLGGGLGLALAFVGIELLLASLPGGVAIPNAEDIGIDAQVLVFTVVVSVVTGVLCGLAPAWRLSKTDLNETLKEVVRGSTGTLGGRRVRNVLMVSEVALALMLLISAGLMIKSFLMLQYVDPGFKADNVLTMEVSLPKAKYAEDYQVAAFYAQALERIAALPGVQAAGAVNNLPLSGETTNVVINIEGRPSQPNEDELYTGYRSVSPEYFGAMGVPVKAGRAFAQSDGAKAPGVAIINETMARRFWPGADPLGKRVKQGALESSEPWVTVVGVVGDVRHSAINQEPRAEMYLPYQQEPLRSMFVAVRTAADPQSIAPAVRGAILSVDKDQPISNLRSMEEVVSDANFGRRTTTVLLVIFAVVALVLTTVGIYGLLAYSVTQRKQEIGIRMALGAQAGDVLKMILKEGMFIVSVGIAIGLVLALVAGRLMSSMLYGVSATDPLTLVGLSLFLIFVALTACFIPARRATRLDPMQVLRYE
ncbi:MAG TPA: ABC transporter permease [Pyrinomonadaceae bacterium]|nr:ABC transporter permease [Pyrinomonadaceae bacterium]